MMKKLVSLLLIMAITSVASAITVSFEVDPQDAKADYVPSEVITIRVIADIECIGASLGAATTDNGGEAREPLYLAPELTVLPAVGTIVNAGGVLVEFMSGSAPFGAAGVAAGATIWSFEYHVPDVPPSTIITIDDLTDMGHVPPYMTSFMGADFSMTDDVGAVQIHVIPEPMTIALLGLGGLLLRRRK
jgi:hypothetical protein